jgi:hypothetical protein
LNGLCSDRPGPPSEGELFLKPPPRPAGGDIRLKIDLFVLRGYAIFTSEYLEEYYDRLLTYNSMWFRHGRYASNGVRC